MLALGCQNTAMNPASWNVVDAEPRDILDGARTLTIDGSRYEVDSIPNWTSGSTYLEWAELSLQQDTPLGWDAAICYAKRAVCRELDAFWRYNHLGHLKPKYPERLRILSRIGYRIFKNVVRDLVINPRNDVEHTYKPATQQLARNAVELAALFLDATVVERQRVGIISLGWSINYSSRRTPISHLYEFAWSPGATPMLIVESRDDDNETALLIDAQQGEVRRCAMKNFRIEDAIELAKLLRKHYDFERSGGFRLDRLEMVKFYSDLGLARMLDSVAEDKRD
jgi:hypothetical protein